MTLHIMAAIAEGDALAISDRTKAGLAALKARGFWSAKKGRYVTLVPMWLNSRRFGKKMFEISRDLLGVAG